jgi:DnaJ-class molecular chaperone
MNYKDACELLEIDENTSNITDDIIKKKYRMKALLYHPDKNKSPDASAKFQKIHEAYDFLLNEKHDDLNKSFNDVKSYKDLLAEFLKGLSEGGLQNDFQYRIFNTIITKITQMCENKAIVFLEKIDKKLLLKIYELLLKNREIFYISEQFLNQINDIVKKKTEKDECIILNPMLEDLFNHSLYKLYIENNLYLIPLWHQELIYDISGSDLYVKSIPILPDNISIDKDNNIYVDLTFNICDIWDKEKIDIEIGGIKFALYIENLNIKKHQTILLRRMGIPKQLDDIFDVIQKADIILQISLHM